MDCNMVLRDALVVLRCMKEVLLIMGDDRRNIYFLTKLDVG